AGARHHPPITPSPQPQRDHARRHPRLDCDAASSLRLMERGGMLPLTVPVSDSLHRAEGWPDELSRAVVADDAFTGLRQAESLRHPPERYGVFDVGVPLQSLRRRGAWS
ncbi:hypothetical protein AB0J52_35870, partial [Spirillospora sp. NPDC049652]